jgi:hypothetical protein
MAKKKLVLWIVTSSDRETARAFEDEAEAQAYRDGLEAGRARTHLDRVEVPIRFPKAGPEIILPFPEFVATTWKVLTYQKADGSTHVNDGSFPGYMENPPQDYLGYYARAGFVEKYQDVVLRGRISWPKVGG